MATAAATQTLFEVDQETENFWRATNIVLNEVPSQLRKFFKDKWDNKYPHMPWDDTAPSGQMFWNGEHPRSRRFLDQSKAMKGSLLNGCCQDWDCTVLFYVLLSSSHQLINPPRHKGSRSHPLQQSEWVDILREERNKIAHTKQAKLPQSKFDDLVQNVEMAFRGLGFSLVVLDQMKEAVLQTQDVKNLQDMFTKEMERNNHLEDEFNKLSVNLTELDKRLCDVERAAALKNDQDSEFIKSHLPSQVNQFTGRNKEISFIMEAMKHNQLITVTGSPGIGKTSVAIEAGHELLKADPDLIICFVDLRGIDSVESIVKMLLQQFSTKLESKKGTEPVEQLCNFLASVKRQIILIFDNSDDALDNFKDLFFSLTEEILIKCTNLKLICTGRQKFCLHNRNCTELILQPLETQHALFFLRGNAPSLSEDEAQKLAISCGCAPLALWIIGNLINDGASSGELIREIDPDEVTSMRAFRMECLPDNSQLEVCINSSYARLSQELQQLFCSLSVFPATFNSESAAYVANVDSIERMLASLKVRSLLSFEPSTKRYSMHPYLRTFARCRTQDSNTIIVRFGTYFARFLKDLASRYYSKFFETAIKTIQVENANIIRMMMLSTDNPELYQFHKQLADIFVIGFIYVFIPVETYVTFYTNLLETAQRKKDKKKVRSLINFCLAYHYTYIDQHEEAINRLTLALLEYKKRKSGDLYVAICHGYIARNYGRSCDVNKATKYIRKVQKRLDQSNTCCLCPKEPLTPNLSMAFLFNTMSNALDRINDIEEAVRYSEKALEIWEEFLSDHLDTARELLTLGMSLSTLANKKSKEERRNLLEKSLGYVIRSGEIYERVIGNNSETADSMYICGLIYYNLQNFKEASNFFKKAVEVQTALYGPGSVNVRKTEYIQEMVDISETMAKKRSAEKTD